LRTTGLNFAELSLSMLLEAGMNVPIFEIKRSKVRVMA